MIWPSVSLIVALFAVDIPGVSARRGGRGSGGITGSSTDSSLDLDSFNTALFSFYVLFAFIAAIQTLQSLRLLFQRDGRTPHYLVNSGIPFRVLLVLTTMTLVASYVMGAIFVAVDLAEDNFVYNFTPGFYTCLDFLPQLADIFFFGGLLILIHHRALLNQIAYSKGKAILDGVQILLLLICAVSTAGINTAPVTRFNLNTVRDAYSAFTHLYVAFYVLTAINIVATTTFVRQKSRHLIAPDQMLRSIALFICPWIAIRATYKIIYDILIWSTSSQVIDFSALRLATLIILGFTFAFMIGVAVRLGLQPKVRAVHQQQPGTMYVKG
ncbi:hypothetical protein BDQ17DRAFT_1434458 [Cyathus striatus]|nr:hypothetical protein BDQ17DRAFT_1434458 [Cyathus striatus]